MGGLFVHAAALMSARAHNELDHDKDTGRAPSSIVRSGRDIAARVAKPAVVQSWFGRISMTDRECECSRC